MEKELEYLGGALANPKRPFVAILGGAKISGKIDVIEALLPKVDALLVGGAMACTFFKAMGLETGKSLVEADRVELAKSLLDRGGDAADAAARRDGRAVARAARARRTRSARDAIPPTRRCSTSGRDTAQSYARAIAAAKTVLWNGPMGVFETPPFDAGTRAVADAMAERDERRARRRSSAAATRPRRSREAGLETQMSHVSTGGGASLEFLEGKTLPASPRSTDRTA